MGQIKIYQAYATGSGAYQDPIKMQPQGFVLHSTGANNPNLKRYVNLPSLCGTNQYNNYFGGSESNDVCPHAVIGKDKNGKVQIVKTLPWDVCCWCSGSGSKGSYNFSKPYIQIEICEDALTDPEYFEAAFTLAIKVIAYLQRKYGFKTSDIVSHKEAHKRGYASNHGDCDHWLVKHGKSMDWVRAEVDKINKPKPKPKQYKVTGTKTVTESQLAETEGMLKANGFTVSRLDVTK